MGQAYEVRDLILVPNSEDEVYTKKSVRKNTAPVYEVVIDSGIDFAVRRTTATTEKLLVILPSCDQYYVKDEKSGVVAELNDANLRSFLANCGSQGVHVGNQWCETLYGDKDWRCGFLSLKDIEGFADVVKYRLWSTEDMFGRAPYRWRGDVDDISDLTRLVDKAFLATIRDVISAHPEIRSHILSSFESFAVVYRMYGIDCTRRFVNRFCELVELVDIVSEYGNSPRRRRGDGLDLHYLFQIPVSRDRIEASRYSSRDISFASTTQSDRLLWEAGFQDMLDEGVFVRFDFDRMCDYLFSQSLAEGCGDNLARWVNMWRDDLMMQIYLTGKVGVKYPDNLSTHHDKLSYESRVFAKEHSEELFSQAADKMAEFDFEDGEYIITHPGSADEMLEESVMQSNCLASYIDRVCNGATLIFFARRKSSPDKSYLTIEVSPVDMRLVQVKAAYNREADYDGMNFVCRWCAEYGISLGCYDNSAFQIAS